VIIRALRGSSAARPIARLQLMKENVERQSIKMVTSAIVDFLPIFPERCNAEIRHTEIFIARLHTTLKRSLFFTGNSSE
jgi:hypothetical protein